MHSLIAVHFRHHDIHEYDGHSGRGLEHVDGFAAGACRQHFHAAPLQYAAQGEYVPHVIIDHKNGLAYQIFVGAVQPLDHTLLLDGQVRHHAVQEQCCLIQQTFRRFDAFDHDAARHRVQLRVFIRR